MKLAIIAAGLALAAAPALADEAAPAPSGDKQKVICKKERPTGSRIPTKVCLTKAEWDAATDATQESLRARGADRGAIDNRIASPGVGD